LDEEVRFEICYKFGFIHCPDVNETFEEHYPNFQNTIIIGDGHPVEKLRFFPVEPENMRAVPGG